MSAEVQALSPETSPWPHRLAVLLCCATFPLIWIGGTVTTYEAGMAVPDWPTTYGYNLFLYPWQTWLLGPWDLFIEHGHRLFASLVGMLTIALCISLWITKQPKWLKTLGLIALAGVIFQGVLGGMRVMFDQRTLAMMHGCVGPAFFAFTAALAVVTSRRWRENHHTRHVPAAKALRWLAVFAPLLAYLQLALGAHLRHFAEDGSPTVFRGMVISHVALALMLTAYILIVATAFWLNARGIKPLLLPATLLVGLIVMQLALGASTWIVKYGWPAFLADSAAASDFTVQARSWWQAQITTAHVATGSLILAISTVLAVRTVRLLKVQAAHGSRQEFAPSIPSNSLAEAAI
ncbi:MAG TPA: COX15/CtaA family protein [Pirellulales bacterium]|jgi:cytochrome c oxidase assembly protein subunit 15|nr:COX15/CtaA family protein [Pirellulales bacterium]